MPLLPYCMMAFETSVALPERGVGDAAVESLVEGGVQCVFSRLEAGTKPGREDALQFYKVTSAVFGQVAIIPFRFPTLLETEEELREFLHKNAAAYLGVLERLREVVQMEVRISLQQAPGNVAASGTEYLRTRQAGSKAQKEAAAAARRAAGDLVKDWRVRSTAQGVRCYVLVGRGDDASFKQRLGPMQAGPLSVTVSGPWPATEFLEPQQDTEAAE